MEEPKVGEKYRHFRGKDKIYEIVCIARDSGNSSQKIVVYSQLYESEFPRGTVWTRVLDEFLGFKEQNGEKIKRFERVE